MTGRELIKWPTNKGHVDLHHDASSTIVLVGHESVWKRLESGVVFTPSKGVCRAARGSFTPVSPQRSPPVAR